MRRIIIHWTGGVYEPNTHEYECYHFLINGNGLVINGKFDPEDNENCKNNYYAKHCGGGNTGSVGIAVCGMFDFKNRNNSGNYLLTTIQCERLFNFIAELSHKYNIPISRQTVMTHYEFGQTHPKTSSFGKIDITYLPPYPHIEADKIGDFIRSKARWYFKKDFS